MRGWQVVKTQMPDGTWTVGCVACRMPLGRGLSDAQADAVVREHRCQRW